MVLFLSLFLVSISCSTTTALTKVAAAAAAAAATGERKTTETASNDGPTCAAAAAATTANTVNNSTAADRCGAASAEHGTTDVVVEEDEDEQIAGAREVFRDDNDASSSSSSSSSCGLFMAESSIPGSGWGMYTGRDVAKGEVLRPADVGIVYADYREQEKVRKRNLRRDMADTEYLPPAWLMAQYYWNPYVTASDFEAQKAISILPGLGMLANSHAGLVNVDVVGSLHRGVGLEHEDEVVDDHRDGGTTSSTATNTRRSVHAGAYSHAHEVTCRATTDLPAGHELFVEYSDEWFASRSSAFGMVPLSTQFDQADSILMAWKDLVEKQGGNESSSSSSSSASCKADDEQRQDINSAEHAAADALSSSLLSDLWKDVVVPSITYSSTPSSSGAAAGPAQSSSSLLESSSSKKASDVTNARRRLLSALPKTATSAWDVLSAVPVPDGSPAAYATVNASAVIRSAPWLAEHGACVDHLEPGTSTVFPDDNGAGVGRGAFARRRLPSGSVVAPAPVVHMSRRHLTVSNADDSDRDDWTAHQLLLNYCYGHPSTSLVFFPYSPVVNLVNHAPTTTTAVVSDDKDDHHHRARPTANVALRWSNRSLSSSLQEEWLSSWTAAEILAVNDKSHLMMELYALRDIEPGEEVFLDYGTDWQRAWERHVQNHHKQHNNHDDNAGAAAAGAAAAATAASSRSNVSQSYVSAWHYETLKQKHGTIYLESNEEYYPPSAWVQVRCFVDPAWIMEELSPDGDGWYTWPAADTYTGMENLAETAPCRVVQEDVLEEEEVVNNDENDEQEEEQETRTYRVIIPLPTTASAKHQNNANAVTEMKVKGVSRHGIVFTNQPYTTHQFLRNAFRHEIGMPEHMIPPQWKDLQPETQPTPDPVPPPDASTTTTTIADTTTTAAANGRQNQKQQEQQQQEQRQRRRQCGLYMAESAIPNAGLGMYTARPISANAPIFSGDVVIPVEDLHVNLRLRSWYLRQQHDHHEHQDGYEEQDQEDDDYYEWLMEHYFWNPTNTKTNFEGIHVQSIVPGLGMLANSHTGLVNALLVPPENTDTGLRAKTDPAAGAVTQYHNVHYTAKDAIETGSELFVQYGDGWFRHRTDLGVIPLSYDFHRADEIVEQFAESIRYNFSSSSNRTAMEELWTETVQSATTMHNKEQDHDSNDENNDEDEDNDSDNGEYHQEHDDNDNDEDETMHAKRLRLLAALPKTVEQVEHVVTDLGGSTARLTVPEQIRSMEWLREHGMCLDNIEPRKSSIRQANMGAFATRFIKAGDVIAPMPMAHVFRKHMEVYNSDDLDDPNEEVWMENLQLLINYCYGHRDSSVLLFPYSPVVNYVNHHSSTNSSNARIQWAGSSEEGGGANPSMNKMHHHDEWFQMTPKELERENHVAGIVMEMVATRDILPGEEVFLYYGDRWDRAWRDHVRDWEPDQQRSDKDVPAARVNRMPETRIVPTESELRDDYDKGTLPFDPRRVMTVCYVSNLQQRRKRAMTGGRRHPSEPPRYKWKHSRDLFVDTNRAHPCAIVERNDEEQQREESSFAEAREETVRPIPVTYTAIIRDYHGEDEDVIVTDIPRRAIEYFDRQYVSEMFLRTAFRHEIEIPDEIMPEAWLDLKHRHQ